MLATSLANAASAEAAHHHTVRRRLEAVVGLPVLPTGDEFTHCLVLGAPAVGGRQTVAGSIHFSTTGGIYPSNSLRRPLGVFDTITIGRFSRLTKRSS